MPSDRNVEGHNVSGGRADTRQGIGALPRKKDDRLMRGRGQFVADIRLAGLQDVAFVRSPLATIFRLNFQTAISDAHPVAPWFETRDVAALFTTRP
jgi:hypothetical protein